MRSSKTGLFNMALVSSSGDWMEVSLIEVRTSGGRANYGYRRESMRRKRTVLTY